METTRNNSFPAKGDKLFISIPHEGRWLPSGIKDIFKLSEGYRLSAVSLYQEIKKNEWIMVAFEQIGCYAQKQKGCRLTC